MDASTVGALVDARNHLRAASHSLSVRTPSPRAGRLLTLCGLERLIDGHSAPAKPPVATALASWVDVPASDRAPDSAQPPAVHEARSQEPARVPARRRAEPPTPLQQPRAAS
jgi:hypothetical protein